MAPLSDLDELQRDALGELFNLAAGRAAAMLSEMAHREVELSVPDVRLVTIAAASRATDGQLVGVSEAFSGEYAGVATVLFAEDRGMNLVRALLDEHASLAGITDLDEEVLTEVGNVVLNAVVAVIADSMGVELGTDLPQLVRGSAHEVFAQSAPVGANRLVGARVHFRVAGCDGAGELSLLFDDLTLGRLVQAFTGRMVDAIDDALLAASS